MNLSFLNDLYYKESEMQMKDLAQLELADESGLTPQAEKLSNKVPLYFFLSVSEGTIKGVISKLVKF